MPKILILYSELAEYTVACLRALKNQQIEIMLVHWPINTEAPFYIDTSFCDEVYSREKLYDSELLEKAKLFNPELILCSGWMDKEYVAVCRHFRNKSVTVLSMDNHWTGSLKQQLARLVSPFKIRNAFSKAFLPGQVQKEYAMKLGFNSKDILTGFYSADTAKFLGFYNEMKSKSEAFPKRFLFLGRYVHHKGIFDLWQAFQKFRLVFPEWELWCVGTGEEYSNRVESDGIRHFGFKQPSELLPILRETGIYILPSHFEPWGVSVHEMAVAGFPILLSDVIGSKEAFLLEGENGFEFQSRNSESLLSAMKKIANQPPSILIEMSSKSHELGMRNTPEIWSNKLLSFLRE